MVKVKPRRDPLGAVTRPADVWLSTQENPVRPPAPLFANAPFEVVGRPTPDGKGAELWTVTPKGTIAAQATATLQ